MPAVHLLAANQINTDTAGKTTPVPDTATNFEAQMASPMTVAEMFGAEGFGHIFSGGLHPEQIPAMVTTALEHASDSVRGKHGGLVPARGSVLAPGPAGGTARAKDWAAAALRNIQAGAAGTSAAPGDIGIDNTIKR